MLKEYSICSVYLSSEGVGARRVEQLEQWYEAWKDFNSFVVEQKELRFIQVGMVRVGNPNYTSS